MKNHPLYSQLISIAQNDGLTPDQLLSNSSAQISSMLDRSELTQAFCSNLKRSVAAEMQMSLDNTDKEFIRQYLSANVTSRFPDIETEFRVNKPSGKPMIILWLKGKP